MLVVVVWVVVVALSVLLATLRRPLIFFMHLSDRRLLLYMYLYLVLAFLLLPSSHFDVAAN